MSDDLIKRLLAEETDLTDWAVERIDQLEERNKEITLQLLATSGQAADALDKAVVAEARLAKAVGMLKTMVDYNKYVIAPFLAELGGKE
jgi:hypothetical protein